MTDHTKDNIFFVYIPILAIIICMTAMLASCGGSGSDYPCGICGPPRVCAFVRYKGVDGKGVEGWQCLNPSKTVPMLSVGE